MKLLRATNAVFLRFRFAGWVTPFTLPVLKKQHFRRLDNFKILFACLFLLTACQGESKAEKLQIVTATGQVHTFNVDVVETPEKLAKGLMFVEAMPEDKGMLFWFGGEEAERGFWMKNTLIPLDMLFVKADGTIHRIHENAIPHDLTSIRSFGPVAAVLEINGGISEKLGLKRGDKVKHAVFQLK